jgi:hypothetical protein
MDTPATAQHSAAPHLASMVNFLLNYFWYFTLLNPGNQSILVVWLEPGSMRVLRSSRGEISDAADSERAATARVFCSTRSQVRILPLPLTSISPHSSRTKSSLRRS